MEIRLDQKVNVYDSLKEKKLTHGGLDKGFAAQERIDLKGTLERSYKFLVESIVQQRKSSEPRKGSFTAEVIDGPSQLQAGNIVGLLYGVMLKAIFHKIYYFFDDEGHLTSLRDLEQLVVKKYEVSSNPCYEEIGKHLKEYFHTYPLYKHSPENPGENSLYTSLLHLSFPESLAAEVVDGNERICVGLLQRLHPSKTVLAERVDIPLMSLITFMCAYKKFVTTQQLFKLVARCLLLSENDMPHIQKLRALHLCSVWCESNLFYREKKDGDVVAAFSALLATCDSTTSKEFRRVAAELSLQFQVEGFEVQLPRKDSLNTERYFKKIVLGECESLWFDNIVELVSTDIKLISAQLTSVVTPQDVIKERKSDDLLEIEAFYNRLVNYVHVSFAKVKQLPSVFVESPRSRKSARSREHAKNAFLYNCISLFISISHALAVKNDFLASFAIFNALNQGEPSQLIDKMKTMKKKHKAGEKMCSSTVILSQYEYLTNLFAPDEHFSVLNSKIKECRAKGEFFVPQFALLKGKVLHDIERIEKGMEEPNPAGINLKVLQYKASLIWWVNTLLQEIRGTLKKASTTLALHTDIGDQIAQQPTDEINW